MTVIHPNSISGIASVTSHSNSLYFYESDHSTKLTLNAHVNGNVTGDITATNGTFSGDVTVGGTLTYDDVTNIDSVGVITARSDLHVISGGLVGIGTDDPSTKLEIQSATDPKIRLQSQESGNKRLELWIDGGEAIGYIAADQSASQLAFRTTGYDRLRITSDGKVGVKVTNPDLTLHVNGVNALPSSSGSTPTGHLTLRAKATSSTHGMFMGVSNVAPWSSWIQAQDANNNATNYPILLNPNGGNIGIGTDNPGTNLDVLRTSNDTGGIIVRNTNNSQANARAQVEISGGDNADGRLKIECNSTEHTFRQDGNGNLQIHNASAERLRITSTGVINCGHGDAINLHSSTTTGINLNGNGNSGQIVANASGNRALIIGRQGSYGQVIEFFQGTNANDAAITIPAADSFGIETAGTERVRIDSAGRMGLGASNPDDYDGEANDFVVRSANHTGITIASSGANQRCNLYFSDGTSGDARYRGAFTYNHNDDSMRVRTAATERLIIYDEGAVRIRGVNRNSTFTVGNTSGTVFILDDTQPSAVGTGGKIVFGSKYHTGANTMGAAIIGSYKENSPSNGSNEYEHSLIFGTNSSSGGLSEKMRIRHDGRVHIGDSLGNNHSGKFQVIHEGGGNQTNDCLAFFETNANDWVLKTNSNEGGSASHYHIYFMEEGSARGSISGSHGQNVNYGQGSDYRWKENIIDLTGTEGIDICKRLRPRKYNWIKNREGTGQINTVDGFIAHEVQEAGVLGAVTGEKDAVNEDGSIDGQMLDYGQMTPVLAAAIKGLIAKVETLEAQVTALQG